MGKLFTASILLCLVSITCCFTGCGSEDTEVSKITNSINNPDAVSQKQNNEGYNNSRYVLNRSELPANRYEKDDLSTSSQQKTVQDAFVTVLLKTNMGNITLKLNQARSPATVENFLDYVREGFYTNTIFHQVQKDFILAAGGYATDLKAKPTKTPIRNEAYNGLKNNRGTIAMRRFAGIHSATSQFIVNLKDNRGMDHRTRDIPADGTPDGYGYCVFGEVVGGWDVVQKIEMLSVRREGVFQNMPTQQVVILSAEIVK